jgi:hypothetical protein
MKYHSKHPWFLFDLVLFIAINVALIRLMDWQPSSFAWLTPYQALLFALAVYRGADIISNERITQPLRAPFIKLVTNEEGRQVEEPLPHGFRGALGSLLYCPSCSGIWVAMVLVYCRLIFPGPTEIAVVILALSAGERFFTNTVNVLKKYHTS